MGSDPSSWRDTNLCLMRHSSVHQVSICPGHNIRGYYMKINFPLHASGRISMGLSSHKADVSCGCVATVLSRIRKQWRAGGYMWVRVVPVSHYGWRYTTRCGGECGMCYEKRSYFVNRPIIPQIHGPFRKPSISGMNNGPLNKRYS